MQPRGLAGVYWGDAARGSNAQWGLPNADASEGAVVTERADLASSEALTRPPFPPRNPYRQARSLGLASPFATVGPITVPQMCTTQYRFVW